MVNTRKWILLADQDDAFRKNTTDLLVSHFGKEIKVVEAESSSIASGKIKNQTFHLIICQYEIPFGGGEEVCQSARQNPFNATCPFIMVTSGKEDHVAIEKKFEFVSCIEKPFDPYEFAKRIRTIFSIGSTEKMISASIFSSLLDSSLAFLEEALKRNDFSVGEMKLKKRGETLTADQAAIITVLVGKVSNTFSVLCDKSTLELLRDSSAKVQGTTLDVICRSLGYVILKHVLTECGIIHSNQVSTKDVTQDSQMLTDKRGIVVPISAKGINYTIFATTKDGG